MKHPTMHKTAPPPNKELPGQNVNRDNVKKHSAYYRSENIRNWGIYGQLGNKYSKRRLFFESFFALQGKRGTG